MKHYMMPLAFIIFLMLLPFLSVAQRLDSLQTTAFMDGVIAAKMKDKKIAGASVAVIQDGKIVMAKGYGFADIKSQTPVDPVSTQFRIGSVSKLFVWTGIMQLVAQGKIDLDTDINKYMVDVTVPSAYDQPITLRHLLTHTPGFEDHILNLFGKDSSSLQPLGSLLRDQMPARVRPPFTQASYSNHGTAMAAYIIEKITGVPFYEYAEKNIIEPLGMIHTTFRQPLPKRLPGEMSKGYVVENNELKEQPFEYVPLYPVGAASSTAIDMTHLMMAFLQHGKYNEHQVLDSATLSVMMSPAHRHHPAVNPMRYGFMDVSQNGETIIGHGGDTFWFHTAFFFLPAHDTGLFVSFNTDKGGGTYMEVVEAFLDEYFPDKREFPPAMTTDDQWLSQFEGEYMGNRYSFDDLFKISNLNGRVQMKVVNHKLKVISSNDVTYYIPIDSTTFREEHKGDILAFGKDEYGNIRYSYLGLLPIFAFEKVNGLDVSSIHVILFAVAVGMTLFALIYWPLIRRIRKGYSKDAYTSQLPELAKTVAWINYLFLLLFIILFGASMGNPFELVYGIPGVLKAALVMPLLMVPLTLLMLLSLIRFVAKSEFKIRSRIYYFLLTLVSFTFLWQLNYWNLLGFYY